MRTSLLTRLRHVTLLAACGAALGACVLAGAKPPMYTTLPFPALQVHDTAEMTQDGITVTVTPITSENASSFPQVYKSITVTTMVDETNAFGSPTGQKVAQRQRVTGAVVPLPAFHVRIVNDTGHVVRLTEAVFRLEDNTGKRYPTFAGTAELTAWYDAVQNAAVPDPGVLAQIHEQTDSAIGLVQVLNRTVELLKGDEWSGFLVFNLGTDPNAERSLLRTVERLKLRLAEIPVETDDAGRTTRTTEFTFTIDKTMRDIDAQCPAGTVSPSWDVCTRTQVAAQ